MGNNLTGDAIAVSNLGTGNTINLAAANGANALLASGGDVVTQGSGVENLTTANAPFTFIGTCNGVPTGTPASHTGAAALIIDRNANRLYAYYGGSWHSLSP
jgi:hypothetical protein